MTDRQTRATCWSITINNPVDADEECINLARQRGWRVQGQKEQGAEGTIHYQLMLNTPQVRFSAVKKAFPRGHIEVARNPTALANYVNKNDTRVGALQTQSELYPSQQRVWEWFADYCPPYADVCKTFREINERAAVNGTPIIKRQDYEGQRLLQAFDLMISEKICEGYYVELIGVNPQIRSAVKNYGFDIAQRETERISREEDITDDASDNEGS